MAATEMTNYICATFSGVETTTTQGYTFFFFGNDRMLPFATLGTEDNEFDSVSNLDRAGVYRLSIGVSRDTFRSFFGAQTFRSRPDGMVDTDRDFTVLDQILPHPVYAPQSWLCVLNPGRETLKVVQVLLQEAYERAVSRAGRITPPDPA